MPAEPHDPRLVRLTWIALAAAILAAFYRGARAPSAWATMYSVPTYGDGHLRRSLIGSTLEVLGLGGSYAAIAAVHWALLAAAVLAPLIAAARLRRPALNLVLALAFAGPAGGYLFHVIGYPDVVLILVVMACMPIRSTLARTALVVAALYVHEIALVAVAPYVLYLILRDRGPGPAAGAALLVAAGFAPLLLVPADADPGAMLARAEALLGPSVRADFAEVYEHGMAGRFGFWEPANFAWLLAWTSPLFAVVIHEVWSRDRVLGAAFAAAALAPLGLALVAWDVDRWYFLAVVILVAEAATRFGGRPLGAGAGTGAGTGAGAGAWTGTGTGTGTGLLAITAALLWCWQFEFWWFDGEQPRPLRASTVERFLRDVPSGLLAELKPDLRAQPGP